MCFLHSIEIHWHLTISLMESQCSVFNKAHTHSRTYSKLSMQMPEIFSNGDWVHSQETDTLSPANIKIFMDCELSDECTQRARNYTAYVNKVKGIIIQCYHSIICWIYKSMASPTQLGARARARCAWKIIITIIHQSTAFVRCYKCARIAQGQT